MDTAEQRSEKIGDVQLKIKKLLDESISLVPDSPRRKSIEERIEEIIKKLGVTQLDEDSLPSAEEVAEVDEQVNKTRYEVGFASTFEIIQEFVKNFINIVARKNGLAVRPEINSLIEAEFSEPEEKNWKPTLEKLLEEFKQNFPGVSAKMSEIDTLVVETQAHTIVVSPAGDQGLSLDFFIKTESADGKVEYDDTSIKKQLGEGSIDTARYLRFFALKITRELGVRLYLTPSDKRREQEYTKLVERYKLQDLTQINRSRNESF